MKISAKHILSLLTLGVFFALGVGSNAKKVVFSDAKEWIPSDFDPKKGTLLVEKHIYNEKQNDKMEEYLSQNYPNSYKVVSRETITKPSGEFADTKKYPFGVLWTWSTTFKTTTNPSGSMSTS